MGTGHSSVVKSCRITDGIISGIATATAVVRSIHSRNILWGAEKAKEHVDKQDIIIIAQVPVVAASLGVRNIFSMLFWNRVVISTAAFKIVVIYLRSAVNFYDMTTRYKTPNSRQISIVLIMTVTAN